MSGPGGDSPGQKERTGEWGAVRAGFLLAILFLAACYTYIAFAELSYLSSAGRLGPGFMPRIIGVSLSSGAMVPLLSLGLPGSASTAVLLAAFLMWGLTPGPLLMTQKPEFAWGLIASMYLGNMALLALNIFGIPLFVQMIKLPYRILAPAVILICTIGTYSVNGSMIETALMFIAGLVGFFMKLYGYSPAALVLALVLGPLAEQSLRQTLTISRGSFGIFLERPASLWVLGVTVVILATGLLLHWRRQREA